MKILLFFGVIIVNLYYNISSLTPAKIHLPIVSIRSSLVSNFTRNIFGNQTFGKGMTVSSSFSTSIIQGDMRRPLSTDIIKHNGDIATDVLILSAVYKDGEYVSEKDYYMGYTYAKSKYYSNTQKPSSTRQPKEMPLVKCAYNSNEISFSTSSPDFSNFEFVESYSIATFVMLKNKSGLNLLIYENETVRLESLDLYLSSDSESKQNLFSNKNYTKFWVIDQLYTDYTLLATQEKLSNDLYFYNLTINSEMSLSLKYFTKVSNVSFNSTQVTKLGFYKNSLLIGTLDNGLVILSSDPSDKFSSKNSSITNNTNIWTPKLFISQVSIGNLLKVVDFLINESTLYIINKNMGMVIIDLKQNYSFLNYIFSHPSLNKFDLMINPFTGSKYLGIGLSNGNNVYEFFLEFLIDDEYNPLLNKVFTTNSLVVYDSFYTVDKFFTYIFDKISKNIIILRRGMINSIPSEVYYLDLSKRIQSEQVTIGFNPVSRIYDYSKKEFIPWIISRTYTLLIMNIIFPYDNLVCSFNQGGKYNISMTLIGEVCQQSMESNYQYTSCDKTINFSFNIYGDSSNDNLGIIISVVSVSGIIFIVLVTFIIFKTKCCQDFGAFELTKDESIKREDMYKEGNRNSPLMNTDFQERPQSEFQLGTFYNGQVLGNIEELSPSNKIIKDQPEIIVKNIKHEELQAKIKIPEKKVNQVTEENKVVYTNKQDEYDLFSSHRNIQRTAFKKKFTKQNTNKINDINAENIIVGKKETEYQSKEKTENIVQQDEFKQIVLGDPKLETNNSITNENHFYNYQKTDNVILRTEVIPDILEEQKGIGIDEFE